MRVAIPALCVAIWSGAALAQAGAPSVIASAPPVFDTNSSNYSLWPTLTATGGVYTPAAASRGIGANCTVAGNVTLTDGAGNTLVFPLGVGFTIPPFKAASFTSTATCTFYGVQ